MKLGLETIRVLINRLGNPDRQLQIIHIAGTNGKGSVSQMTSSILQEAGYLVGVFNSPHLITPEECIRINDVQITREQFESYIEKLRITVEDLKRENIFPSYFEVLTALALMYFKDQGVDFVLLEVGLGGALDATNVIENSLVSVLTKIAKDHTDFLGDTLEAITRQKTGIIKPNGLVVTPIQQNCVNDVIEQACDQAKAQLHWMDPSQLEVIMVGESGSVFELKGIRYETQLIGTHQAYNGALAIEVIYTLREKEVIRVTDQQIKEGIVKAKWQGRFEKISDNPKVFIDGAHNADGIKALADTIGHLKKSYTIGIVGILRDKEVDQMLETIAPYFDYLIATEPCNPRAMKAEELAEKILKYGAQVEAISEVEKAIKRGLQLAQMNRESQIIAFGSLYMIGKVRTEFIGE